MFVGSLADGPVLAMPPAVSGVITDQHESHSEIIEQLGNRDGTRNLAQSPHGAEVPWYQYSTSFQLQTLRRTDSYKLPRRFQLGRPLRHIIGVVHTADVPEESDEIRSVLEFQLVNIVAKVAHIPIAVRIVVSAADIGDLLVVGPGKAIVVTVGDPELEVVAGVGGNDPARILRFVAQLQWGDVANDQFVVAKSCRVFVHLHQGFQRRPRPALVRRSLIDQIRAIEVVTAGLSGLTEGNQRSLFCLEKGGYFETCISFGVGGEGNAGNVNGGVPGIE